MFNLLPWRKKKDKSRELTPVKEPSLVSFRREFDSLFDRFLSRWSFPWPEEFVRPAWGLDWEEREDRVVVKAEVPGFEPEELDVQVSGQLLTIKAEHQQEAKHRNGQEQSYRSYQQTIQLPAGFRADQIEARYHNGILEVHVPRSEEARPKRIPVKACG